MTHQPQQSPMINTLRPAPAFRRDRFKLYWVSVDTGAIFSRSEMANQLKIYEQTVAGRKAIEGPPRRKESQAQKLFGLGRNL